MAPSDRSGHLWPASGNGPRPEFIARPLHSRLGARAAAEQAGCLVCDEVAVLSTALAEAVRRHAAELVGRRETRALLDLLAQTEQQLVSNLMVALSMETVQAVLRNLLRERVSLAPLSEILRVMLETGPNSQDSKSLTERVRLHLAPQICEDFVAEDGRLHVMTLAPAVAAWARAELGTSENELLLQLVGGSIEKMVEQGRRPVLVSDPEIRAVLRGSLSSLPLLTILSRDEVEQARLEITTVTVVETPLAKPSIAP